MKQKIVIKVAMYHDKCRSKALKIAVGGSGVESAALTGEGKDQVEVVGDGIDSVKLTRRLRKKVARAELVSVAEAKPAESKADDAPAPPPVMGFLPPPCYGLPQNYHCCEVVEPMYGSPCTIL
ncbi:Heavy metal-associated isoprenylated plant protein 16 [Sesamum alatum]|uniref:Heavy metal-associated isoprenylated plant protein 16 n=1 Tax=Sesamum alatum TaxID=300844 RepID=A0AAE1YRF9_9LAMI|nr:Heavy metal-associated isoprenylated plant protein 16 [Sesamum alatum]